MAAVPTPAFQTRSGPAINAASDQLPSLPERGLVESSDSRRLFPVDQLITEGSSVSNGVGALGRAVTPPSQDPWEPDRQPALVAPGWLDAFKPDFEHQFRLHRACRTEAFTCVTPDPSVQLEDLAVTET